MIYGGVAVGVGLLALLLLFVAFKLLKGSWLLGWLRGSAGLFVLLTSGVVGLLAWDLSSYVPVAGIGTVATVSFSKQGEQQFSALVADASGGETLVDLQGELWRVDLRRLRWNTTLSALGLGPGYRLADIRARYLSIEQEQQADRVAIPLIRSRYGVDGWQWIHRYAGKEGLVEAQIEPSAYLPMVDDGLYQVEISAEKVDIVAVNEPAKAALAKWK
ncbi:hypothetical protein MIB92_02885 [Aestuariirhabdus sp. Z084]|uniref:hypothetical protein n=1 Tax=Aestuariirhabdus haliotis TaxID=2918751 RepID=UPI00201B40F8|nr:hypothetical protein [Aestuariirhabdus haliotis]MCL6414584.1 hypothetical protein [Aestuariirhabdus haliotis]MCL6418434.1 hypothetical protein [Aestuariirhabdus haliotis]